MRRRSTLFLLIASLTALSGCEEPEPLTQTELADELFACAGSMRLMAQSSPDDGLLTADVIGLAKDAGDEMLIKGATLTDPEYARYSAVANEEVFRVKMERYNIFNQDVKTLNFIKREIVRCTKFSEEYDQRVATFEDVQLRKTVDQIFPPEPVLPKQFTALLTCGISGRRLDVRACFKDTELKITQNNQAQLYKIYNLRDAGELSNDGLKLVLSGEFELVAQNSHKHLVLGIEVVDESGTLIHQDQVGQWDVIRISN